MSMSPIYSGIGLGTAAGKKPIFTPQQHLRRVHQRSGARGRLACIGLSALMLFVLGGATVLLWWNISYQESVDFITRLSAYGGVASLKTGSAQRQFEHSFAERHLRRRAPPAENEDSALNEDPVSSPRALIEPDFKCADGSSSRAVLNDDYCDCLDGSDEPGTSACSDRLAGRPVFLCKGPDGKHIFASRVQDGVVDCVQQRDDEQYDLDSLGYTDLS